LIRPKNISCLLMEREAYRIAVLYKFDVQRCRLREG
jgi:hypothetical protein